MASPSPSDFVTTDFTSAATSFVVNIPTTAVAGDRVVVGFGYGVTGQTITGPASGVIAEATVEQTGGGTNGLYALVYEVQGSETTITIGTSVSTKAAAVACRIEGDSDSTAAVITTAFGSNGPPDPPASADPGASAIDALFVALGSMGGETAMTAAPTNYSNFTEADSGTAGAITSNSRTGIGTRQLTTDAPEDPGAFTGGDATQEWAAATILFAPAGGNQQVDPAALSMTLTAVAPSKINQQLSPAALAMTLAAVAPSQVKQQVNPAALAMTLTPVAPSTILVPQSVSVDALAMTLTPVAPSQVKQQVDLSALAMTLSPIAPQVNQSVSPAAQAMTLTPVAPTISQGTGDQTVSPDALAMTLAAVAPSQIQQSLTPAALAMTLAAVAPSIAQRVSPGALAMTLAPVAPSQIQQSVSPAALSMALAAVAPEIQQIGANQQVSVPVLSMTLTPLLPQVFFTIDPELKIRSRGEMFPSGGLNRRTPPYSR